MLVSIKTSIYSNIEVVNIVNIRNMGNFELRDELWSYPEVQKEPILVKDQAYTPSGDRIGDKKMAFMLDVNKIMPEKIDSKHSVCSIGQFNNGQGWAGWSHRAMCKFKIGDKLFDPDWKGNHTDEELDKMSFTDRGPKTIETMEEAKQAAINFARYVS